MARTSIASTLALAAAAAVLAGCASTATPRRDGRGHRRAGTREEHRQPRDGQSVTGLRQPGQRHGSPWCRWAMACTSPVRSAGCKPGDTRGFHIHEKGDCSAADATSAGGHFNPGAQAHGRSGHGAHHAGDTDNIVADAKGVARSRRARQRRDPGRRRGERHRRPRGHRACGRRRLHHAADRQRRCAGGLRGDQGRAVTSWQTSET
jgi:Cu/Zn superoxide dismutase